MPGNLIEFHSSPNLDKAYLGLVVSDEIIAKVLSVSELARMARAETRLRSFVNAKWDARAAKAVALASHMASRLESSAKITRAVNRIMEPWSKEVIPTFAAEIKEIYRLGRIAGYKKGTRQIKASLQYNTPNFGGKEKVAEPVKLSDVKKAKATEVLPSFDLVDDEAAAALGKHQEFWIGEHYGKNVADEVRDTARKTMIEAGKSRKVAGELMKQRMKALLGTVKTPGGFKGTSKQYFEGLVANAATVGRVHGQMRSFSDIGITRYKIVNPGGKRICPVCAHLQGKVFEVRQGAGQMQKELAATKPDDIKDAHPWFSLKRVKAIAPNPGEIKGTAGTAQAKAFSDAGLSLPPFHFRCRCTVDISDDIGSYDQLAPFVPPVPPKVPGPTLTSLPLAAASLLGKKPPKVPIPREGLDAKVILAKDKTATLHGTSFRADGDKIENFDVQVWRIKDSLGEEFHEFQFKVTTNAKEKSREFFTKKLARNEVKQFTERAPNKTGQLVESGEFATTGVTVENKIARFKGRGKEPGSIVSLGSDRAGAIKNQVTIQVNTADPEKAMEIFQKHSRNLGIDDVAGVPSKGQIEDAIKAKLIFQYDPDLAASKLAEKTFDSASLDVVWKELKKKHPQVKAVFKDATLDENFWGHQALFSKAQANAFKKAGLKNLYHDVTIRDPDDLVNILVPKAAPANGGLMSSTSRFDRGIFTTGASTERDFVTGGADGVFTRIAHKPSLLKRTSEDYRFVINPKEMGRLDWWAFNKDRYGKTSKSFLEQRFAAGRIQDALQKKISPGKVLPQDIVRSNEVMFQKGIKTSSIDFILTDDENRREALLAAFKKRGIKKINGIPVGKFVRASLKREF